MSKEQGKLFEIKHKLENRVESLEIEIITEKYCFTHLTKINEYDDFEVILDRIISDMSD